MLKLFASLSMLKRST